MYHNQKIAVIGARQCDQRLYDLAEETGNLLAMSGYAVICGGLGGVMEAVCKGAKASSGLTIGILPGENPADANPFVDIERETYNIDPEKIEKHLAKAKKSGKLGRIKAIIAVHQLGMLADMPRILASCGPTALTTISRLASISSTSRAAEYSPA